MQYQDALLYFVYPWFMALLFLIAVYALLRRVPVARWLLFGERRAKTDKIAVSS